MPTYTVGPGKTYSTISAAVSAIPTNVAGTGVHNIVIDAGLYQEDISIIKNNLSASDYINVMAAPGSEHLGNINSGVRIQGNSSSLTPTLRAWPGVNLYNLVIIYTNNYQFYGPWLQEVTGPSIGLTTILENVIAVTTRTSSAGFSVGNSGNIKWYKCLAIALSGASCTAGFDWQNGGVTAVPYNCGAYNCVNGFRTLNNTGNAINCWSRKFTGSSGSDFSGILSSGSSNNASSDATAPGALSLVNASPTQFGFVSPGNNNFHITAQSSLAIAGVSQNSLFTADIDLEPISSWPIGPDAIPSSAPAPTTAASPWVNKNRPIEKVKDAKGLIPSVIDTEVSPETEVNAAAGDAKGHNPHISYGDSSPNIQKSTNQKDASGYSLDGNKGQRTGFISLMPELNGYGVQNPGLGTGFMMPFFAESLALAKEFRELDLVGARRTNNQRRAMYQSPEGKVEFAIRSNDIIPVLQTHFQKRIGTTPSSGTTYYEFVPNKGRVDLNGSAFGTGSYVDASVANALPVSIFKDIGGNGFLFKTGVADKLTFKFHAMIEPTVEAAFKFREGTPSGTSPSHPYGTYSNKPGFSPTDCSVDFLGMSVIDLEFTSDNQIEARQVMGDARPIHKFGQHSLKGQATIDFGKNVFLGYGSVLSGSAFAVSATMYNAAHDQIIFQMPNCKLSDFPTGFAGIYNVPFQAYASEDGSTAPIKVQVWTQNYDAYSFQPS